MFSIDLTPRGIVWTCTIPTCSLGSGAAAHQLFSNPLEACEAALKHCDQEHPGHKWSARFEQACHAAESYLNSRDLGLWHSDGKSQELALPELVAAVASALGHGVPLVHPDPDKIVDHWGADPLTMDTMHDPRLIEVPQRSGPTRNWTTNHQLRWAVGEAIQHPPEGSGCQTRGARVGEDVEVCALPKHNPANIKHVFAIGERVTRIAHN